MTDASYEIIRSPEFFKKLKKIFKTLPHGNEYMEGVEWALARDPRSGLQCDENGDVWCVYSTDRDILGQVVVYYTFEDATVTLLDIEIFRTIYTP